MAKLKKMHVDEINNFLREKGLIHVINTYLQENNIKAFEVASIKLRPRIENMFDGNCSHLVCQPGERKVEVCTIYGKCECQCI